MSAAVRRESVALMAPAPALWRMMDWLGRAGFEPDTRLLEPSSTQDGDEAHPAVVAAEASRIRPTTLVTYYPTAAETLAAVTPVLLQGMGEDPLWLQCGPMPTHGALAAAEAAARAGVTYCHAPYVTPPNGSSRPRCRLYEPERRPGAPHREHLANRGYAAELVAALASDWSLAGSLYFLPASLEGAPQ